MAIEEALFSLLSGDPGVKALLNARIFGVKTPEVGNPTANLPAVAYWRVSATRYYTMDTTPGAQVLVKARFQFDCKAIDSEVNTPVSGYDLARQVAQTITAVMRGFKGTVEDVDIEGIFELDDRDVYDPQTKIYAVQKDFQVLHLE